MYDIIIFGVVHLQQEIFHTKAFNSLVSAIQREKDSEILAIERRDKVHREQQVFSALKARKHLRLRKHRVEWLKRGLLQSKHGSVDTNLGRSDQYFNSMRSARMDDTSLEHDPLEKTESVSRESRDEMEPLNPFTEASPRYSSLRATFFRRSLSSESAIKKVQSLLAFYFLKFKSTLILRLQKIYAGRRDTDSYLVYTLLLLTFVYEFTVMTSLFPLILFGYALLTPTIKSMVFWHSLFYYVEICLTLRYCFWIPFGHSCSGFEMNYEEIQQSSKFWLLLFGIQPAPFPYSIPMLVLYLSIVWHHERVLHLSKVHDMHVRQKVRQDQGWTLKSLLSYLYWSAYNFVADICSKSEDEPYIIHVSLKKPEGAASPWNERSMTEAHECIHRLYRRSFDPDIMYWLPQDLCERLKDVDISFCVKSIEPAGDESVKHDDDVMILEICRIILPSHKKLIRPVSDIAAILKYTSDNLQRGQENEGLDDFRIREVDAVMQEELDFHVVTLCVDTIAFLFVVLFYQACLSTRTKSLTNTFSLKSVFPADYIYALVILSVLTVCDRVIYVLSSNFLRVMYHFATLVFFLTYLMVQYWSLDVRLSSRVGQRQLGLEAFFALKSLSFLFSALQVKANVPTNTLGHWLMKRNVFHFCLYTVYRSIPFLPELRMMLDWTFTKTTLEFFDWFRVEEIRNSMFQIDMANFFRQKGIGLKQPWYTKLFQGFLGFTLLGLIIWGPLLLYSSNNPAIVVPQLIGVSANMTLTQGTRSYPIFYGGQETQVQAWKKQHQYFTKNFNDQQVKQVLLSPSSDVTWAITPPRRAELQKTLEDGEDVDLVINFLFKRNFPVTAQNCLLSISRPLSEKSLDGLRKVLGKHELNITSSLRVTHLHHRTSIFSLNSEGNQSHVPLSFAVKRAHTGSGNLDVTDKFYNSFVQLGGNQLVCEANNNFRPSLQPDSMLPVNCSLGLSEQNSETWWELFCDENEETPASHGVAPSRGPQVILVFDKTIGESVLSTLFASRGGLIGLYVSFVLVVGRFIHISFSSGLRQKIWVDQLPSTHKLKSILEDIDAARAEMELAVEEELYWGLIRIYRMPAILFELTKKQN